MILEGFWLGNFGGLKSLSQKFSNEDPKILFKLKVSQKRAGLRRVTRAYQQTNEDDRTIFSTLLYPEILQASQVSAHALGRYALTTTVNRFLWEIQACMVLYPPCVFCLSITVLLQQVWRRSKGPEVFDGMRNS